MSEIYSQIVDFSFVERKEGEGEKTGQRNMTDRLTISYGDRWTCINR